MGSLKGDTALITGAASGGRGIASGGGSPVPSDVPVTRNCSRRCVTGKFGASGWPVEIGNRVTDKRADCFGGASRLLLCASGQSALRPYDAPLRWNGISRGAIYRVKSRRNRVRGTVHRGAPIVVILSH
jgi:hypothetical protein